MVTLEELIKIKGFESEEQKAVVGLMYVANLVRRHQEKILERQSLTYQQFNILWILRGQYPNAISLNLIKGLMVEQTSDVSRLIDRMRKVGLITNKLNKEDKRVRDVLITAKGLTALDAIDKCSKEMYDDALPFKPGEAVQFNLQLQQIINALAE